MDSKSLMNFGLTKNESLVYLTLAETGESKVSRIIKKSKFKSGKIYQVLDSLLNKGIISYSIKNNVKHYSPGNPEKILEYIKLKKYQIVKEEENFQKLLPEINKIIKTKNESCQIKIYESIEGIRTALFTFVDQLSTKDTIFLYGANDEPKRDAILSWPKYNKKIVEKEIKTKILMTNISKEGRKLRKNINTNKEYKYLAGTDLSNFMVCKNTTILFNFNQPNCIYIENKDYAEQFKELFFALWKTAKTFQSTKKVTT